MLIAKAAHLQKQYSLVRRGAESYDRAFLSNTHFNNLPLLTSCSNRQPILMRNKSLSYYRYIQKHSTWSKAAGCSYDFFSIHLYFLESAPSRRTDYFCNTRLNPWEWLDDISNLISGFIFPKLQHNENANVSNYDFEEQLFKARSLSGTCAEIGALVVNDGCTLHVFGLNSVLETDETCERNESMTIMGVIISLSAVFSKQCGFSRISQRIIPPS